MIRSKRVGALRLDHGLPVERQSPGRRLVADPLQIRLDTDRDKILTASEAVDYGIIDQVFDYRKLSAQS